MPLRTKRSAVGSHVDNGGNVLGEIAATASKCLDREAAGKFVWEAAARLAKLRWVEETYSGLSDLAEAQARLGDVEAAKRSAKAIGERPSRARVAYDMTDGQPYALLRVAKVQREAGDTAGARETLRDGFRSVSEHPKMRGRDGRYLQIAHGQFVAGDLDGAARTVGAMEEYRSEILASLARAHAAGGDDAAARTAFARALIDARRTAQEPLNLGPRSHLAMIQAMAGDVPGALKTVRSIGDELYERSALLNVVSARAMAGDVAGALRLCLDESKTPDEPRSALEGLGQGVESRLSLKTFTR
jgi:hypothetical protein